MANVCLCNGLSLVAVALLLWVKCLSHVVAMHNWSMQQGTSFFFMLEGRQIFRKEKKARHQTDIYLTDSSETFCKYKSWRQMGLWSGHRHFVMAKGEELFATFCSLLQVSRFVTCNATPPLFPLSTIFSSAEIRISVSRKEVFHLGAYTIQTCIPFDSLKTQCCSRFLKQRTSLLIVKPFQGLEAYPCEPPWK